MSKSQFLSILNPCLAAGPGKSPQAKREKEEKEAKRPSPCSSSGLDEEVGWAARKGFEKSEEIGMAFGKHWEWRGFGALPPEMERKITVLPLRFPEAQHLTDEYLWLPSSSINVKLRLGCLKLKRFLRSENGLEEWLENTAESYPFPLSPRVIQQLCQELGVRPPSSLKGAVSWDEFPGLLRALEPSPRVIPVEKKRWQREYAAGTWREPVTVEIAEIHAPEPVGSVGLEHSSPDAVARALDFLGLPGPLRRLNYLEALAVWGGGKRLAASARKGKEQSL
jgi:hypothetical protein